ASFAVTAFRITRTLRAFRRAPARAGAEPRAALGRASASFSADPARRAKRRSHGVLRASRREAEQGDREQRQADDEPARSPPRFRRTRHRRRILYFSRGVVTP